MRNTSLCNIGNMDILNRAYKLNAVIRQRNKYITKKHIDIIFDKIDMKKNFSVRALGNHQKFCNIVTIENIEQDHLSIFTDIQILYGDVDIGIFQIRNGIKKIIPTTLFDIGMPSAAVCTKLIKEKGSEKIENQLVLYEPNLKKQ